METDIKKIENIAKLKEKENWAFRSFLKGYDLTVEELDSIVNELNTAVSAEIDCTRCANCCKKVSPVFHEKDIQNLYKHIGISERDFQKQFLKKDLDGDLVLKACFCPFLKDNLCTHYAHRPQNCESYPHLHKKDFVFRLIGVLENYEICPIVFNVYELLKAKFRDHFIYDE